MVASYAHAPLQGGLSRAFHLITRFIGHLTSEDTTTAIRPLPVRAGLYEGPCLVPL